jgi:hypothetical protein
MPSKIGECKCASGKSQPTPEKSKRDAEGPHTPVETENHNKNYKKCDCHDRFKQGKIVQEIPDMPPD